MVANGRPEDPGQDAGGLRPGYCVHDRTHSTFEGSRIALRCSERLHTASRWLARDIAGEGQVHRTAMVQRSGDEPFRLSDAILWRDDGTRADRRRGHLVKQVELSVPQSMMHYCASTLRGQARLAGKVEYRQMFGVGSGDAAEGIEFTGAVSCVERRQSFDTGVSVGRVGGIELVA